MNTSPRQKLHQQFLTTHGWNNAQATPLNQDASFRSYTRLRTQTKNALLMDAPPPEDAAAFVKVTEHLAQLGTRVPEIYAADLANGFLLLEDLGDATFTNLLNAKHDERDLYARAVTMLAKIHSHANATDIDLPPYYFEPALEEAILLPDWYAPARNKRATPAAARQQYADLWQTMLADLPTLPPTLVLRDFHCDNLMLVGENLTACAPLDYQDALIGSPAYDLMSLLEDARRDIDPTLAAEMLAEYLRQVEMIGMSHADFERHYIVWAAHRHCKVAGIFVRLWLRDGKDVYLHHLPRVMKLLQRNLNQPVLHSLRDWLSEHLGELDHVNFTENEMKNPTQLLHFAHHPA